MAPPPYNEHYEPKDALGRAAHGAWVVGAAGALLSAVQNSLAKQNVGAMGFLTRTGGSIGIFGMCGGITSGSGFLNSSNQFVDNSGYGGDLSVYEECDCKS